MTRQSAYKLKQRIPVVAERWARAQAIGRARPRHGDGFGPPWPMRTLGPCAAKTKVTELAQNLQDSVRCVNTPELSGSVAQTGIRPIRSIAPREIDLCLQRLADAEAVAVAQEALGRAGLARGSGDAGKVHGHVCVVERP